MAKKGNGSAWYGHDTGVKCRAALAAQGERHDLIDVQVLESIRIAIIYRVPIDLSAVGRNIKIGEPREAQQVVIAVAMNPGATALTVIPRDATSLANDFVSPRTPDLEAE